MLIYQQILRTSLSSRLIRMIHSANWDNNFNCVTLLARTRSRRKAHPSVLDLFRRRCWSHLFSKRRLWSEGILLQKTTVMVHQRKVPTETKMSTRTVMGVDWSAKLRPHSLSSSLKSAIRAPARSCNSTMLSKILSLWAANAEIETRVQRFHNPPST